jgi:nucleoid-associated protein YgaU
MMGSFEKLGILVIVVIIVMILAVAVYQWGGAGVDLAAAAAPTVDLIDSEPPISRDPTALADAGAALVIASPEPSRAPPKTFPFEYVVARGDNLWSLVRSWGLKDAFAQRIAEANPQVDVRRLKPGTKLLIPDPAAADKAPARSARATRIYEVQEGDDLSSIAKKHLGSAKRYPEILELNPKLKLKPHRLYPGDRILLPAN